MYGSIKPKKSEGNYTKRGDVFAIITHLPGQKKWNEFSVVAGYNYKTNSNPEILIDQKKFQLFTSGSRAWSFSPSDDEKIINFLKKSIKMKVVGTSSRGTITTDSFSLLGFSKAIKKLTKLVIKTKVSLMNKKKKIVLAFSGGLDTSIILKWLQNEMDAEVVTFTADIGQEWK